MEVEWQNRRICGRSERVYGSAVIVGTVQEKSKHARDSVVMLRDNNQYRAGRVPRFLSHTAPGCEGLDQQQDVNIADVQLYATVPPSNRAAAGSETILNCPIFKRNLVDSPIGNLWPIVKLAPSNFAMAPHHSGQNNLVALNRFSSWKSVVPP